ncbi:hypothetical protein C0993_006537 [Termitomyces sp. T159_Od127]|nr:hypothetical protein C0993_006537 [Termitomyces sp. T159_Od127]
MSPSISVASDKDGHRGFDMEGIPDAAPSRSTFKSVVLVLTCTFAMIVNLGILAHAFPPSRARSIAFSTFAAGAPVGAAFGMALGGVLTEVTRVIFTHKIPSCRQSWRSPFYLETGFTVLCLIGGIISFDPDVPSQEKDRRVDWPGAILITAGLVLIIFVLGQGEVAPQGWKTPYIIALLIVGVILVVTFIFWQLHLEKLQAKREEQHRSCKQYTDLVQLSSPRTNARSWLSPPPLMKVSLWTRARGRFAAMMLIAFLEWCAFLSWGFWAQLYYQNYRGYSPLLTVIRVLPMFVSGVLCNIFVAAVVAYVPVVFLLAIGTLGTSMACLLFAIINPDATYWAYGFPSAVITVFGADFVFASGTLFIAKVAEPHEQSLAGALFQTMTQIGTSLGVTVTTVIFDRVTQQKSRGDPALIASPPLASYQAAQWGSFAFGVLSMLLSILFFYGVGIVGHTKGPIIETESEYKHEQEETVVSSRDQEKSDD